MTDKQLEAAARRFCRLEGVDPDEGTVSFVLNDGSRQQLTDLAKWRAYAHDIKRIYHAILAIEMAMEEDEHPSRLSVEVPCVRKNTNKT